MGERRWPYTRQRPHAHEWVYDARSQRGSIAYDTCALCGDIRGHIEGTPEASLLAERWYAERWLTDSPGIFAGYDEFGNEVRV